MFPFSKDLHRAIGAAPGPAERAGVTLGDVILGINYVPLDRGLVHTAALLAEAISRAGFVKLQVCVGGGSKERGCFWCSILFSGRTVLINMSSDSAFFISFCHVSW